MTENRIVSLAYLLDLFYYDLNEGIDHMHGYSSFIAYQWETRRVSLFKQELLNLPDHLLSSPFFIALIDI